MFLLAQNALKDELHTHLATSGCISLTTDTQSAWNYRQFIAVTGHWIDTDWKLHSRTIDLLKLTEPIHSSDYLVEKLLEITSLMSITHGVFTITRDNAKPNDVMLEEYKSATYLARTTTQTLEQPWHFTQKEGDVRCIRHIINLVAQAALTQLKATLSNQIETYQIEPNTTYVPVL